MVETSIGISPKDIHRVGWAWLLYIINDDHRIPVRLIENDEPCHRVLTEADSPLVLNLVHRIFVRVIVEAKNPY